jgi:Protein of unknown function (DUF1214)
MRGRWRRPSPRWRRSANEYVLHFDPGQTPPVASMWNLAMYDDAMFFIPNEFGRFTIGSTTDGVTQNPDGSVTFYIQHTRPGGGRAANWLPAPKAASASRPSTIFSWPVSASGRASPSDHSSTLEITLSVKGTANIHSSIMSRRTSSNFLNGSCFW